MADKSGPIRTVHLQPKLKQFSDLFRRIASYFIAGAAMPSSPRSPWQNGYAERLIGSIRRDVSIMWWVRRAAPAAFAAILHGLSQCCSNAPVAGKRPPFVRPVHAVGRIQARPVLGGLHHQYIRI